MVRKKPKPDPTPTDRPVAVALEPDFSTNDPGDPAPADTPPTTATETVIAAHESVEPAPAESIAVPPPAGPGTADKRAEAARPAASKPFAIKTDATAGVTLREDRRFRQVQLQFRDKPGDAVRGIIREAGFRWQPTDRVWVKPIDRDAGWKTRLDAERLFQEVVEEIAHEQGIPQVR